MTAEQRTAEPESSAAASPTSPKDKTEANGTPAGYDPASFADTRQVPVTGPERVAVPHVTGLSVLDAALAYAAGGLYVGPLKHRTKHPGSVLGDAWETKTSRDQEVIRKWFPPGTNRGVFVHCGRSGVLVFDVDNPAKLHSLITEAIGKCAPPWQNTRPADPDRRHYLFAMPEGRMLGNSTGGLGGDWGQVRGRNGVIVVAPSVHEDADGGYTWGEVGEVPPLPDYLASELPNALDAATAASVEAVEVFLDAHTGEHRPELLELHLRGWQVKVDRGESRHDTMAGHLAGAMKEASAGYYPARTAADTLESMFLLAVANAGHGKQGVARSGAEAASEWAGLLGWAVAQAEAADVKETAARSDGLLSSAAEDFAVRDFFDQTPVLQRIRQAAHSRTLSAPVLLVQVLARVLLEVPPGWQLPAVVGSTASLNVGFAVVGLSSAGKSSSLDVSDELLELQQDAMIKPIGSGEGMIDAFFDFIKLDKKVEAVLKGKPHCLFTADEVEQLQKLIERSGSTLGALLRIALTGGQLGTTNAHAGGRDRNLPRRVYRLVMVVAIQPALSGVLLDAENAGTPQRFLWFGGADPTLPQSVADIPAWPGPLPWNVWWDLVDKPARRVVEYPEHIKQEVQQTRLREQSDPEADPLKGHLTLTRLKVAAALAFLHQELDITDQWWELAGVLADASVAMQEHCRQVLAAESAKRGDQRARAAGRSKVIEGEVVEFETARRKVVSENIIAKVTAAEPEGISWSKLRNALPAASRDTADQVRDLLVASGQLRAEEVTYRGQAGVRLYLG
jgi:hypothetical protein